MKLWKAKMPFILLLALTFSFSGARATDQVVYASNNTLLDLFLFRQPTHEITVHGYRRAGDSVRDASRMKAELLDPNNREVLATLYMKDVKQGGSDQVYFTMNIPDRLQDRKALLLNIISE